MILKVIQEEFSVCKVEDYSLVDLDDTYCFLGKTDEEKSLVCRTNKIPANVYEHEDGWKGFRIEGILDFSLIGILSKISSILARNNIGIFVVSTYNTDYVFVKQDNFEFSLRILEKEGYTIQ